MVENDSEYVIRDDLFSANLKYSIVDNFDDLIYPPVNTFPAQVRSDIKEYLKNMNDGILIGRAQIDYHVTPKKKSSFNDNRRHSRRYVFWLWFRVSLL